MKLKSAGVLVVFVAATLLSLAKIVTAPRLDWSLAVPPVGVDQHADAKFETVFDYQTADGLAHSPAIQLIDDKAQVIWFEGSREGASDVVINAVALTANQGGWRPGANFTYLRRQDIAASTQPRQEVLKLGNTIQYGSSRDKLLATIVSLGGWAAASVAVVETGQGTILSTRKLNLSPFINRSHLVRAPTVSYADGTIAVPAYMELGNAFGEWVRLDSQGRVRDKRRMLHGRLGIQPMVVPFDADNAVSLMRNFDSATDRLVASWTRDGGQSWSAPVLLDVANPNAPVAVVRLSDGRLLMAYNDRAESAKSLSLAVSKDRGQNWRRLVQLENGPGAARYPAMERLPDGQILLTYSVDSKRGIRAHVFNEAWLGAQ